MSVQVSNPSAPMAVVLVDPNTGAQAVPLQVTSMGTSTTTDSDPYGANYTNITANGTNTIAAAKFYYRLQAIGLGTLWTASVYDIAGTNTATLAAGLAVGAIGSLGLAAPAGVGLKLKGSLVVVTAGTLAGNLNVLWD